MDTIHNMVIWLRFRKWLSNIGYDDRESITMPCKSFVSCWTNSLFKKDIVGPIVKTYTQCTMYQVETSKLLKCQEALPLFHTKWKRFILFFFSKIFWSNVKGWHTSSPDTGAAGTFACFYPPVKDTATKPVFASHCLDTNSDMQQEKPVSPIEVHLKNCSLSNLSSHLCLGDCEVHSHPAPASDSGGERQHRHHLVHPRWDERSHKVPDPTCKGKHLAYIRTKGRHP